MKATAQSRKIRNVSLIRLCCRWLFAWLWLSCSCVMVGVRCGREGECVENPYGMFGVFDEVIAVFSQERAGCVGGAYGLSRRAVDEFPADADENPC